MGTTAVVTIFGALWMTAMPALAQSAPDAGTEVPAQVEAPTPAASDSPSATPSTGPSASATPSSSPSDPPTPTPSATPTPTPTPSASNTPIRINFQPRNTTLVCGWTPDHGDTYGARNSLTYGWNFNHTDGMRDRGRLTDQLLDTLAHFHSGGIWEIQVPNGTHEVKVSIGDTSHSSRHTVNVEGVNYWNNISLSTFQFRQLTKTVTVSDGKLTLDQGTLGHDMTHINYVEIDTSGTTACAPTPTPTPTPSASTPAPAPSGSTSSGAPSPTASSISPSPTKSATPTPTPTPTATPTPTPSLSQIAGPELNVNFQLEGSSTVCGYKPDYGHVYGARSGSAPYGWNFSHAGETRDRGINPDQLLDTLVHFKSGGVWETEVETGIHTVTVSIGDAGNSSTHYLMVEGVQFWNGVRLGRNEFVKSTRFVPVTDGKLTVTMPSWAPDRATRINYIEIDSDGIAPTGCPTATPTPTPTPTKTPTPTPTPTKTPTPGVTPTPNPTPTPTPSPTGPLPERTRQVRVNFQLEGSPKVCGYDPDYGYIYDARNGATYGWNFDHSDVTRDRELVNEQKLDTLSHFHSGGVWELKLRKGVHSVTVGIGDAGYESNYTLNVEGQNFWRDVDLGAQEFRQMTREITVRDGRLTLDQGNAPDKATRIQFITVNTDGPPPGCDGNGGGPAPQPQPNPQPSPDKDPGTSGGSGGVGARPYGLSGLVRVFGKRCSDRSNNARTWFPSAGGRGREGYVYYHSKLARKVGGRVLGGLNRNRMRGAVDYGVWGYSCRIKRGGTSWSVHSWGVAIDTNTLKNPWQATRWNGVGANGRDYGRRYPRLWLKEDFYWGIHFRDPMHFQYVAGY